MCSNGNAISTEVGVEQATRRLGIKFPFGKKLYDATDQGYIAKALVVGWEILYGKGSGRYTQLRSAKGCCFAGTSQGHHLDWIGVRGVEWEFRPIVSFGNDRGSERSA